MSNQLRTKTVWAIVDEQTGRTGNYYTWRESADRVAKVTNGDTAKYVSVTERELVYNPDTGQYYSPCEVEGPLPEDHAKRENNRIRAELTEELETAGFNIDEILKVFK